MEFDSLNHDLMSPCFAVWERRNDRLSDKKMFKCERFGHLTKDVFFLLSSTANDSIFALSRFFLFDFLLVFYSEKSWVSETICQKWIHYFYTVPLLLYYNRDTFIHWILLWRRFKTDAFFSAHCERKSKVEKNTRLNKYFDWLHTKTKFKRIIIKRI